MKMKDIEKLAQSISVDFEDSDLSKIDDDHDGIIWRASVVWKNGARIEISHPKKSVVEKDIITALFSISKTRKMLKK